MSVTDFVLGIQALGYETYERSGYGGPFRVGYGGPFRVGYGGVVVTG